MHPEKHESFTPNVPPPQKDWRLPLSECDCYLDALEEHMMSKGQGRHIGVTMLELGPGFCLKTFAAAVQRFTAAYPILFAYVHRSWFAGIPEWRPLPPGKIEITVHHADSNSDTITTERLRGEWHGSVCFDIIQRDLRTILMMSWAHLLFDGRGAELVLVEIHRLAADLSYSGLPKRLWGLPQKKSESLLRKMQDVRPFAKHHSELRRSKVHSLSIPQSRPGALQFQLRRFSEEETRWIYLRAEEITGGIFLLPFFLAVVMRAHAKILKHRRVFTGALECAVSAQQRKRGTQGAIFQNQVSQLFFSLPLEKMSDVYSTSAALQDQFARMNKSRLDKAFLFMSGWMRRLPKFLYKPFISRSASGNITSFYYAHTGAFLPTLERFCRAEIIDGWHIPSVFQPPGTGVFFSERNARLTCSLCWREGVVHETELESLISHLREDLLAGFQPTYSSAKVSDKC
jgi:hypothetical protein